MVRSQCENMSGQTTKEIGQSQEEVLSVKMLEVRRAEQLVEVPPLSPLSCVLNAPVPQMETELVEVPIISAQSALQQLFEQTVGNPGWWEAGFGNSSRRSPRTEFGGWVEVVP